MAESHFDADFQQSLEGDALWRMELYRLSVQPGETAWKDVKELRREPSMRSLSDQLYRAVGSIGANIAKGYSRQSARDQASFYEYALGSAREARPWYHLARPNLGITRYQARIATLTAIIRSLLSILRAKRPHTLRESTDTYVVPTTLTAHSHIV